jgi:hypothetical protein
VKEQKKSLRLHERKDGGIQRAEAPSSLRKAAAAAAVANARFSEGGASPSTMITTPQPGNTK